MPPEGHILARLNPAVPFEKEEGPLDNVPSGAADSSFRRTPGRSSQTSKRRESPSPLGARSPATARCRRRPASPRTSRSSWPGSASGTDRASSEPRTSVAPTCRSGRPNRSSRAPPEHPSAGTRRGSRPSTSSPARCRRSSTWATAARTCCWSPSRPGRPSAWASARRLLYRPSSPPSGRRLISNGGVRGEVLRSGWRGLSFRRGGDAVPVPWMPVA